MIVATGAMPSCASRMMSARQNQACPPEQDRPATHPPPGSFKRSSCMAAALDSCGPHLPHNLQQLFGWSAAVGQCGACRGAPQRTGV